MFTGSLETRRNPPKPMLHSLQHYFLQGLGYSSCLLLRPTHAQILCWAENEAWDLSLLLPLLPSPLWISIPSRNLTVRKGTRRWPQVVGRIQRDPEWKRTRVRWEEKCASTDSQRPVSARSYRGLKRQGTLEMRKLIAGTCRFSSGA